ncbi:serine/threonine-protein kinase [Streptomyces sp. NPDC051784]|uniref:serine/threonine-protein kinase n=1 Tax=Streptomyces sp. NPDC051784 TaxID=3155805 RepID=UPI0034428F35
MASANSGEEGDGPRQHEVSEQDARAGEGVEGLQPLTASDPPRIGPYLLLGRLGAGGMGRVYLARAEGGRTVAVKVVHEEHVADPQFRARFRREIDAARRVGKRHTAPVLDADPDANLPWVATGYIPGLSLEEVVRRHGPLPPSSVRALAQGLLKALDDIHGADIVHRDLKPSNIMLTVNGPRVIDFGIARALETSAGSVLTSMGLIVGSPGFMSPEQIRGQEIGPKSDVFSLGCVLNWAVTGQLAFGPPGAHPHSVNYHAAESAPDLERVGDTALRDLISRCLTKDVDERPDVAALLSDDQGARSMPANGAWLPPDVIAELADRSARLLDVDAAPLREEPRDRETYALRRKDTPDAGADVTPTADEPRTGRGSGKRRRNWFVAIPLVVVVTVGGGTAVVLGPWSDKGDADAADRVAPSSAPSVPGSATASPPGKAGPSPSRSKSKAPKDKDEGGKDGGGTGPVEAGGGTVGGTSGGGSSAAGGSTSGGSSSGGSSSGGGSGTSGGSSSGGGSSTSGGSTGGSGSVPTYFVGTWKHDGMSGNRPHTIVINRASEGGQAVRYISDLPFIGHCEWVGRLDGVSNAGSRLEVTSAPSDKAKSTGITCDPMDAAVIYIGSEGGVYHLDHPSQGDGYHYIR